MLTAETITDEQIRELYYSDAIDHYTRDMAIKRYHTYPQTTADVWRAQARARCAEIINARASYVSASSTRAPKETE